MHDVARAIVTELVRGQLVTAPIHVVNTVGILMMLQSEPPEAMHAIGQWLTAMTERGRQEIMKMAEEVVPASKSYNQRL